MLSNVPDAVNRMTRNVVVNHPNTFEAQLFRKKVTRSADESMGGLPTLGGMGSLDSEDEEEVEYEHLGNGYALPAEAFSPGSMMDRGDSVDASGDEFRFLIEPECQSGEDGWFSVKTRDVMYLVVSDDIKLAFEVVGVETTTNIPPYTTRYVCNRRADVDITDGLIAGWEP